MAKYRKKPVIVDAELFGGLGDFERIANWARAHGAEGGVIEFYGDYLHIRTLEGTMMASPGDWVICGVKSEFYPCKPDVFEATYEPAVIGGKSE